MAKLTLKLVEGDSISFQMQGEFLEIAHIKKNKEIALGLLGRADLGHLNSFLSNELFHQVQQASGSVFEPMPGLNLDKPIEFPIEFIRKMVKEREPLILIQTSRQWRVILSGITAPQILMVKKNVLIVV